MGMWMAVGELTGGIAHDFNNLLTVVIGNAELLEERLDGSSGNLEMIKMIRAAAESGAELTQWLLAFARRQPLTPRVIDVEQLLRSMTSLMKGLSGNPSRLISLLHPTFGRSALTRLNWMRKDKTQPDQQVQRVA